MEFRSLLYFISAAKYENLTRASEELNITQPALSRQIRLLEEEIGFTIRRLPVCLKSSSASSDQYRKA